MSKQKKAYRIKKWDERHSNYEQKRTGGRWICCPTSFDSLGLRSLLRQKRGLEAFAVYVLLAELVGKMNRDDGLLVNSDGLPLTAEQIEVYTGVPSKAIVAALQLLEDPANPEIMWVDQVAVPTIAGRPQSGTIPDNDRNHSVSSRARAQAAAAAPAAGGAGGALALLLKRARVPVKKRPAIHDTGVTFGQAIAHWNQIRQDDTVKHVERVLTRRLIDAEEPPALTMAAVIAATREGLITQINGVDAERIEFQSDGAVLDGQLIAPIDEPERLELS